ncbi:MAG: hypothetical protein ABJF10_27600 [Chthoniobacter sp.]|uniref:hypothetical protein n=1 Tax=Chthoniobacter sp. TaxID=2510640 RepID=UPI0032A6CE49
MKGGDLALVLTEWQMPPGPNLFSTTRIVGQVLAWKGGVASVDDESRLDREFFTFRGSDLHPFDALPFHGLSPKPCSNLKEVREWLAQLGSDFPELEVERGSQDGKAKWRGTLDRVGIDTELFEYHLKMNAREGGAAELFKVKDTMEFVDLFLEMALNSEQADMAREQIESVREKLMRLPQKEIEERFVITLLGELRPLAHEAEKLREAEGVWREKRRENFLLRSAIESSIETHKTRLSVVTGELTALAQQRIAVLNEKKARQEYRLNYSNLARELTYLEAFTAEAEARRTLQDAAVAKSLAGAALRFARIMSRQEELNELRRQRELELTEQKPVIDELRSLGASYTAALDGEITRLAGLFSSARVALAEEVDGYSIATNRLTSMREELTRTKSELENVKRRLIQRDQRRADLRKDECLLAEEKAAAALARWEMEQRLVEKDISDAETRIESIDSEISDVNERLNALAGKHHEHAGNAAETDKIWQRGNAAALALQERASIREVMSTDTPSLDFPDLPGLLHTRLQRIEEGIFQSRFDTVDDERTLRAFESERLFPPTREVDLVLAHLRSIGVRTALPAYRFLATNASQSETATRWLASDPARYSGIVVTSESEFLSLKASAFVVPGLRHPVQVTLSANPASTELGETAVALPANEGAFNHEAAVTANGEIETRVERATEHVVTLTNQKEETTHAVQALGSWRDEFGNGALDRIAAERDQMREEAARIHEQIEAQRARQSALREERAAKVAGIKEWRPEIAVFTRRQERLRSYITEYEDYAEQWMEERRAKLVKVEQLGGEIATQEREVARRNGEVKQREERVRNLDAESAARVEQRAGIRFLEAELPAEALSLEAARTRYENALARFEDRFGHNKLEGRIEQAESTLSELRSDHRRQSGDLSDDDVAAAAKHDDLEGRKTEAERMHLQANSARDGAVTRLAAAEADRPDVPAHKQGLGLPPEDTRPANAAEAIARRDALDVLIETDNARLADFDSRISTAEKEYQTVRASIGARTPHLETLDGFTDPASGATPSLPADDMELTKMVSQAKRQTDRLASTQKDTREVVETRIGRLREAIRREEFVTLPVLARERLGKLPEEELLQRLDEFIQSHDAWQKVLRNEIETLARDKDLVVRALDGVASSAIRLLAKADRASLMPNAFPGWTGQPFLRINANPVTEPAARRDRLAALVARLVAEKAIPAGHKLASAALREVGGAIRVTLLKPEDPLRPDRHDITEFGSFSGGEKMTAAILLYATLAHLRIRGRDEHGRDREAGVLLLDNPFGTASKREFVELQLRVARQMGVQLIYTTGVNDLGALDVLPRILRLRKRHRDRRSGDLLISQEQVEEHLESVQANLR